MNDQLREAAERKPQFKTLAAIAKANGHITLQQEAAIVIAQGTTSVEELQRMLQS